jgi:hypothetical protein
LPVEERAADLSFSVLNINAGLGANYNTELFFTFRKKGQNSMSNNFIPNSDPDFLTWVTNFSTYLSAHAEELGIETEVATAIASDVSMFRGDLNGHVTAQDAAHAACQRKDSSRDNTEQAVRKLVRQLQVSDYVSDIEREAMGLPVHSEGRRLLFASAQTRPIGSVDTAERLRHTISYHDEATPTKKARPDRTMGCEIWHTITASDAPAPLDPTVYSNMGINTATPFVAEYDGKDVGKMAHYLLRWVGTTGQPGPWSEIISATIVG